MTRKAKLTSKRRRTESFRFEVGDPQGPERDLLQAQLVLRRADDESRPAAQAAVDAAQAEVDACYDEVLLRALPPALQIDFQHEQAEAELRRAAAAKAAKEADEPEPDEPEATWTADSFEVRLIAACDADGHTAEEWAEAFAGEDWTLQDRADLIEACHRVNSKRRQFDFGLLGKG